MQEVRGVVKQLIKANEIQLSDVNFSVLDILKDQVTEMEILERHIYNIKEQIQSYNRGELGGVWDTDTLKVKRSFLTNLSERYTNEFKYLHTLLDEVELIKGKDHRVVVYYLLNPYLDLQDIADDLGYELDAIITTLARYNKRLSGSECGRKIRGSKLDELRIALAEAQIPLK